MEKLVGLWKERNGNKEKSRGISQRDGRSWQPVAPKIQGNHLYWSKVREALCEL